MEDINQNISLSEQYRVIAKKWVDADRAASLMEETKSSVFAEMTNKLLVEHLDMAVNRAETMVRSGKDWREFVTTMVKLRSDANLHKVHLEYIRMKFSEWQSHEATRRAEMKL